MASPRSTSLSELETPGFPDRFRRDGTAIEVADTARALLALAQWARPRLDARVVGVTGSVGKTSAKDLMAATCSAGRRTTANERSFNNEQGLPVTILNAPGTIDADYRGEIQVILMNAGNEGFEIKWGDRIAQLVVAPVTRPEWVEVVSLDETERGEGGFGHTGRG